MPLGVRLGRFLLFVGLVNLALGYVLLSGGQDGSVYFLAGAASALLGLFMRARFKPPPPPQPAPKPKSPSGLKLPNPFRRKPAGANAKSGGAPPRGKSSPANKK